MKKLTTIFLIIISLTVLWANKPKNIILLISDGTGFNHVKATNYYQYGKKGQQTYQKFSVSCAMSTYSIKGDYKPEETWRNFENPLDRYTDSAAAGTAIATGIKTYNGAIGVDTNKTEIKNLIEYAEDSKMSTGVISSVMFSHATPASFVAHNPDRGQYEKISQEMITESKVEVIMGAGHPYYNSNGKKVKGKSEKFDYQNQDKNSDKMQVSYKYVGGEQTWKKVVQNKVGNDCDYDGAPENWKLIQKRAAFKKLSQGKTPERVLGVPQVRNTLHYARKGESKEPFDVPLNNNIPRLAEMTSAGLNVLDNNKNGFFLMVEGGAVDWASHGNNSSRMIEELTDFNNSVQEVVNWVNENSNWQETLVIVTSDHECGYLFGPKSAVQKREVNSDCQECPDRQRNYIREIGEPIHSIWKPIQNNGENNMPGMKWYSEGHSNLLVPFYAQGAGSKSFLTPADQEDLHYGKYLDNTELGQTLIEFVK